MEIPCLTNKGSELPATYRPLMAIWPFTQIQKNKAGNINKLHMIIEQNPMNKVFIKQIITVGNIRTSL